MTLTFRKRNNVWCCIGPASEIKVGEVEVTKKDGSRSSFEVGEVSAPFPGDDGKPWAIGYPVPKIAEQGGLSDRRPCVRCDQEFTYSDCKLQGGCWKEGYCGC